MRINADIFKQYDIRGVYQKEFTSKDARRIGQAFGTYIQQRGVKEVTVGHDNRTSSGELYFQLIEGLVSTGCIVTEVGLTLTPIIDFSWYYLKSPATVMVTASHSPVRYNGFKFSLRKTLIFGENLQLIRKMVEKGKFAKGKGERIQKPINEYYVQNILKTIKPERKLNVVIDCGNGTGSILAPQLLHQLGFSLTMFHSISDGMFPYHDPYPQKVADYEDHLVKAIREKKADVGIAFDGDCDRMGVFDEKGNFIENDKIIYLHALEILKENPHASFVVNVAVSQGVIEAIQQAGGTVHIWKTGPPYMLPKMKETDAKLGGEISGHFAFADRYFGFDDGVYAACRTLELISKTNKPISQMFNSIPHYFSTPEFRILTGGDEKKKFRVIERLADELKKKSEFTVLDVDGLRVTTKDGWFLIRASQTEPLVTGRIEAKSEKRLEELKKFVQKRLEENEILLDWKHPISKH
ncbi:MAG: phosphomannomutase/phosphoglucomutase [Candidatus Levyibacteriota bacterium]